MKTFHYIVQGMVQGVSFRYYTIRQAERLGIQGTVANLDNGAVEVYAQGDAEAIALFEEFLHRGPSLARVESLVKEELEGISIFSGFDVVY